MNIVDHTTRGRSVALVGLTVLLVSGVVACGDADRASSFRRESVGASPANPFMEGVDTAPPGQLLGAPVSDDSNATTTPPPAPAPAVTVALGASNTFEGDTPGLYGGTKDAAACDATKMAAFLDENPDKAAAWAGVLGIDVDDITGYISLLTATVLRADTAVTNHGFEDGRATTVPAVLQAGTAVFVDDRGEPVVKCSCGNPLTPPAPRQDATFTGDSWKGFSAGSVTAVSRSTDPIDDITLVDGDTDTAFTRPIGTDGDADVPHYPAPEDVEEGGDTEPGDTTSDTTPTPTTTTVAPTDTTSGAGTTPSGDAPVEMTSTIKGVSGDCAGEPPTTIRAQVSGGTITFPELRGASGAIAADGSFDFTITTTPDGLPDTTAVHRYSGRVDPPNFSVAIDITFDNPTGRVFTCQSRTPEIPPPTTTTASTTAPTTTLAPLDREEPSFDITRPLEQTWYFESRFERQSAGCDALGVSFTDGPPQRIRVREVLGEGRTITFLGRPSRTFDVAADGTFRGQLIAAGEGNPDQMVVTVGGGPVPSIGQAGAQFGYGQDIGSGTTVPGTFTAASCGIDFAARPV